MKELQRKAGWYGEDKAKQTPWRGDKRTWPDSEDCTQGFLDGAVWLAGMLDDYWKLTQEMMGDRKIGDCPEVFEYFWKRIGVK